MLSDDELVEQILLGNENAAAEWSVEKCRNAVLLGMYFLANY